MGNTLYGHCWDYRLRTRRELQPGDVARPFSDVFSALSFLRGFIHDPFAKTALREVASRSRWDASLFAHSDQEVLRQLAWQLATGRLYLVPIERTTDYGPTGVPGRRPKPVHTQPSDPSATQPQAADRPPHPPGSNGAHGAGSSQGTGASQGSTTPAAEEPTTTEWIQFQIIDDDTEVPVAGVDLRLKLPDGSVTTFTTNDEGLVYLGNIDPGTCDLERMLDMEAFEVIDFV